MSKGVKDMACDVFQASKSISQLTSITQGLPAFLLRDCGHGTGLMSPDHHLSSVHDWLSPLYRDFGSKHYETFNTTARQDGLGLRLLNSPEYRRWFSGDVGTMWCVGSRKLPPSLTFLPRKILQFFTLVPDSIQRCISRVQNDRLNRLCLNNYADMTQVVLVRRYLRRCS